MLHANSLSDCAVQIEGLSKQYVVTARERYYTLRDALSRGVTAPFKALWTGEARPAKEEFWALKDVNFQVKRGEIVGIIGRNGAGKSTLLKILSRITVPSRGRVLVRGRVASLLEIGTGFHPELTGRENIFLNGAILGMTQREIREKFDEIVAFAEVERFLDTPVKHYSSGMSVRLAFAVAAHLEPDILVIDEVLAVGDAEFQKKSLGKMDEVTRREGRTVLFVSHNMGIVSSLCRSAIWLDCGMVRQNGPARDVIGEYLVKGALNRDQIIDLGSIRRPPGTDDRLRLESLEWLCDVPLRHGEPFKARIQFKTQASLENVSVGLGFSNANGGRLLTYETDFHGGFRPGLSKPGIYSVELEVDELPLAPDIYGLDFGCRSGDFHSLEYIPASTQVEIIAGPKTPGYIVRKDAGVRLASKWTWQHLT